MQTDNPSGGVCPVWSDSVCLDGDRLIIHATEPMDWPVREFSRIPILFRDRKYYCRTKSTKSKAEPPYAMRYELWPWPNDSPEACVHAVYYDEVYVEARNRQALGQRRGSFIHFALLPFYPVLGLFWSGFKHVTLGPIGFESSSITKASLAALSYVCLLQYVVVVMQFALQSGGDLMWASQDEGLWGLVKWAQLLVCSVDCMVRFLGMLRAESSYHLGFFEWLRPRRASS